MSIEKPSLSKKVKKIAQQVKKYAIGEKIGRIGVEKTKEFDKKILFGDSIDTRLGEDGNVMKVAGEKIKSNALNQMGEIVNNLKKAQKESLKIKQEEELEEEYFSLNKKLSQINSELDDLELTGDDTNKSKLEIQKKQIQRRMDEIIILLNYEEAQTEEEKKFRERMIKRISKDNQWGDLGYENR